MTNPWDDEGDDRPDAIDADHYVARDGSGGWQQRWKGDGLAVVAPTFMNWSGERVQVPKVGNSQLYADQMPSTFHRHDASCLVEVEGGVRSTAGGEIVVPEENWVACTQTHERAKVPRTTYYHRHGPNHLMAHMSGDEPPVRSAW